MAGQRLASVTSVANMSCTAAHLIPVSGVGNGTSVMFGSLLPLERSSRMTLTASLPCCLHNRTTQLYTRQLWTVMLVTSCMLGGIPRSYAKMSVGSV